MAPAQTRAASATTPAPAAQSPMWADAVGSSETAAPASGIYTARTTDGEGKARNSARQGTRGTGARAARACRAGDVARTAGTAAAAAPGTRASCRAAAAAGTDPVGPADPAAPAPRRGASPRSSDDLQPR